MRADPGKVLCLLAVSLCFAAPAAAQAYYNYAGAVHMHTLYSDGSGTFEDLANAGQAAGVTYLISTDHNTLEPLRDGHQRYWGSVLMLVGTEISTDAGHLLALNVPPSFDWGTRNPQEVLNRVNAAGGLAILAHPLSERWPWTDWGVRGYAGMETINLASLMDADLRAVAQIDLPGRTVRRLADLAQRYLRNPDAVMDGFTDNTVDTERTHWDALLRHGQQVVGTAGVDAHARIPVGNRVFEVPTYQEAFESAHTYAVTLAPLNGNAAVDVPALYGAYRNGRLYLVYPRVAPAPAFRFIATEGERQATMGQPFRFQQRARLVVEAPGHSHPLIRLLRNGVEVAAAEAERLEWETTEPGAYRVEVFAAQRAERLFDLRRGLRLPNLGDVIRTRRRELRPWILSNPIYVRRMTAGATGQERVVPTAWTLRASSGPRRDYAALEAAGYCCCTLP